MGLKKEEVAYAKNVPLKKNQVPICWFCEKQVTEDDYCYGCKHFVCQDCDHESPIGIHDVEEHQEEEAK